MTKKIIAIVAAVVVAGLAVWGGFALFGPKPADVNSVVTPTEIVEVVETPAAEVTPAPVG